VLITAGLDGRDVGGLAVEVHEDEGLRRLAGLGLLLDDRAGERGIHVPAALLGIDEDGLGAEIGDGRRGSDEGQRRAEDFVAGSDASQAQGEMERGGTGRDGDGMLRTDEPGEIFLESIEIRTCRRDPIGFEGFEDEFDFCATDVGGGEVKTGERHWV